MENWKEILGFDGRYQVSNLGRVRNALTGHVKSLTLNKSGYPRCSLSNGHNKFTSKDVHRLVAMAFLSGSGECVNHKDGVKTNNTVSNLEWCSRSKNNIHAASLGLAGGQKITPENAKKILEMRPFVSAKDVADMYGICTGQVYALWRREIHKYL